MGLNRVLTLEQGGSANLCAPAGRLPCQSLQTEQPTACLPDSTTRCHKLSPCTLHKVTWWDWESSRDSTGKNRAKIPPNFPKLLWNATSSMKLVLTPPLPMAPLPAPGQNESLSHHSLHSIYTSLSPRLTPPIFDDVYCHQVGERLTGGSWVQGVLGGVTPPLPEPQLSSSLWKTPAHTTAPTQCVHVHTGTPFEVV